MENFIIFGSHIGYSRWKPLHNHFIAYHDITYIQKNIVLDINFMIVRNFDRRVIMWPFWKWCHKMRLRGGKNWTPIFQAYLAPIKEAKKAIKSILAKTVNFTHFSDIPHQTIYIDIMNIIHDVYDYILEQNVGLPKKRNLRNPRNPVTVTKSTV